MVLVLTLVFISSSALSAEDRGIQSSPSESPKPPILDNYTAFIIGINAYKEWYPLKTAVKDATALKELLPGFCTSWRVSYARHLRVKL